MEKDPITRLGQVTVREELLHGRLAELRQAIETWAKQHYLWHDAGFHTPYIYNNEAPKSGDVLYLCFGEPVFDSTDDKGWVQLNALLSQRGFAFELENYTTMAFYPTDERLQDEFLSLYRWQWIQHLAGKRLFDIHCEVFEHFARQPDDLKRLTWRQYEQLLDAVFRNQGFFTKIGTGSNDGGVDIRLYQSHAIPPLVILVQAKRYVRRPVSLDAVAALFGIAVMERATRGILATTSRFQPKARLFASSTESRIDIPTIELVDSHRVGEWCAQISSDLNDFFRTGGSSISSSLNPSSPTELVGRIVVARGGHNVTINYFCVIEADFRHEVILRPIGSRVIDGDSLVGYEIPDDGVEADWADQKRFVALKDTSEPSDMVALWGDRRLFILWDGSPKNFNNMD